MKTSSVFTLEFGTAAGKKVRISTSFPKESYRGAEVKTLGEAIVGMNVLAYTDEMKQQTPVTTFVRAYSTLVISEAVDFEEM